jgi:hypothetical protein
MITYKSKKRNLEKEQIGKWANHETMNYDGVRVSEGFQQALDQLLALARKGRGALRCVESDLEGWAKLVWGKFKQGASTEPQPKHSVEALRASFNRRPLVTCQNTERPCASDR